MSYALNVLSLGDLCDPNPCGVNAQCQPGYDNNNRERPVCTCLPGYVGNALSSCNRVKKNIILNITVLL